MKQFLFLLSLLIISTCFSQVGIGTTSPDDSSILELQSTNSGFLLPRIDLVSLDDIVTIPNPAEGLMIYNLSSNCILASGIYIFNGNKWRRLAYTDIQTYSRLIRDEIGVSNVTFTPINTSPSHGTYTSLFDNIDNTAGSSFHMTRLGSPAGDWGFGITLPEPYFISELVLDGRNDCCVNRIVNILVRLYRCGNLVYSSPPLTSATINDNNISIPSIFADEIRLVIPNGGNEGNGGGIINFSELDVVAND